MNGLATLFHNGNHYSRPFVQPQRSYFTEMCSQIAMDARAFDAHEHTQIQTGPFWRRCIAIHAETVARHAILNHLHRSEIVWGERLWFRWNIRLQRFEYLLFDDRNPLIAFLWAGRLEMPLLALQRYYIKFVRIGICQRKEGKIVKLYTLVLDVQTYRQSRYSWRRCSSCVDVSSSHSTMSSTSGYRFYSDCCRRTKMSANYYCSWQCLRRHWYGSSICRLVRVAYRTLSIGLFR